MKAKKTVWAVVLALLLTLSPALGLEPLRTQFADVSPQAWYANGVTTCANEGIMVGDDAGLFHPETRLTQAECLTLALRLYAPNKELEKAPDDWGKITLTLADGTVLDGYGRAPADIPGLEGGQFSLYWGSYRREEPGYLCVRLEGDTASCEAWGEAREGKATVKVGGLTISGTVECWIPLGNWVLSFHPDAGDGSEEAKVIQDVLAQDAPAPDKWYRDAFYTAHAWGLVDREEHVGFYSLAICSTAEDWANRELLAAALGDVAPRYHLTRRVEADDIPDVEIFDRPYLKTLYEGGILNGVDEYGGFYGQGSLTRAEAAVMVARLLDENQRLSSPLKPLPKDGYTLTETAETWEEVYGDGQERPELVPKEDESSLWSSLYGYVDQDGEWVILPKWDLAEDFIDGYAVVLSDDLWYAIDDMGRVLWEEGSDALYNLGEGKFWSQNWDGDGFPAEIRDIGGNVYPAPVYGQYGMRFQNGYAVYLPSGHSYDGGFYVDSKFRPVSGKFDRCGALDEHFSGLVELDGKIYRIQFD